MWHPIEIDGGTMCGWCSAGALVGTLLPSRCEPPIAFYFNYLDPLMAGACLWAV